MRLDPSVCTPLARQESLAGPWPVSSRGLPRIGWAWALVLHGAALGLGLGALIPARHAASPAGEIAVLWAPTPASEPGELAAGPAAPDGPASSGAAVAEVAGASATAGPVVEPITELQDAAPVAPLPAQPSLLAAAPAPEEAAQPALAAPLPLPAPPPLPEAEPAIEAVAPHVPAASVATPQPTVDEAPRPVLATQPAAPVRTTLPAPPPARRAAPVRQANLNLSAESQRRRGDVARPLGTATSAGVPAPEGPVVPASASAALLPDSYKATLGALLRRGLRYPPSARDRDEEGDVVVAFSVARDGTVRGARVVRSSGISAFDQEALALLARISPAPPLPSGWAAAEAAFVVPVRFQLR